MKYITRLGLPVLLLALFVSLVVFVPEIHAFDATVTDGADAARGAGQSADLFGDTGIFQTITNILLYVLGAISVIMIIIGGLRYVVSGGNSNNVTAAKNTILYAIVGLIIAVLSYAIINFVLSSLTGGSGGGTDV